MEEFFKTKPQIEIDKEWLTQLCWDGQMADEEIEEFVEAVILWKDKSISTSLIAKKKEIINRVNDCKDFDKRDARIIVTQILK